MGAKFPIGAKGLSPVVRRCYGAGRRCGSYVLFCHLKSFCRVFFSSTLLIAGRLRVALAKGSYKLRRETPVYNIPCRTTRACVGHLVRQKRGMTVYRRMRSPGGTGKLMGHRIMEVMAPKAALSTTSLSRAGGGCLVSVISVRRRFKYTVTSVAANSYFLARISGPRGLLSRVGGFMPTRVVYGSSFCVSGVSASSLRGHLKVYIFSLSS